MMKKFYKTFVTALLLTALTLPIGARSIRDFFLTESGDVFKSLPSNRRAEMLAYNDVGMQVPTEGNFGENATLVKVTGTYLSVITSASSDVQMKMLISGRDTTLLVVNTVKIPARDSRVRLFDKNWTELNSSKALKLAKMEDFISIPKGAALKKQDVLGMIRFPIISYTVDSITDEITAHQELKDFMSKDDYKKVEPYLKDSIVVKK